MTLNIEYKFKPLNIFGDEPVNHWTSVEDFTVMIDDKIAPPFIRDLILTGIIKQAEIEGKTFTQVAQHYLKSKAYEENTVS